MSGSSASIGIEGLQWARRAALGALAALGMAGVTSSTAGAALPEIKTIFRFYDGPTDDGSMRFRAAVQDRSPGCGCPTGGGRAGTAALSETVVSTLFAVATGTVLPPAPSLKGTAPIRRNTYRATLASAGRPPIRATLRGDVRDVDTGGVFGILTRLVGSISRPGAAEQFFEAAEYPRDPELFDEMLPVWESEEGADLAGRLTLNRVQSTFTLKGAVLGFGAITVSGGYSVVRQPGTFGQDPSGLPLFLAIHPSAVRSPRGFVSTLQPGVPSAEFGSLDGLNELVGVIGQVGTGPAARNVKLRLRPLQP